MPVRSYLVQFDSPIPKIAKFLLPDIIYAFPSASEIQGAQGLCADVGLRAGTKNLKYYAVNAKSF